METEGKTDVFLIVNPKSGVDRHRENIITATTLMCDARGKTLEVRHTRRPGDAERLAREAAEHGCGTVIVSGGDGTIRDAAEGLWNTDTLLGVVPMGSGNGVARSLGVPQLQEKALQTALDGHYLRIDRGRANGQSFYSAFGVGFDAEVSQRFALDKKRGKATYIKHAVREIFKYQPGKFRLVFGDNVVETEAMLVAVCNCMQYGSNAYIAPKADPADGKLDVTVVHSGNFFSTVLAGIDLFSGTLDRNILVENFKTDRIEVIDVATGKEMITHLDGEPLTTGPSVKIECERRGLKIAVPQQVAPFKPVLTPIRSILSDLVTDVKKSLQI